MHGQEIGEAKYSIYVSSLFQALSCFSGARASVSLAKKKMHACAENGCGR